MASWPSCLEESPTHTTRTSTFPRRHKVCPHFSHHTHAYARVRKCSNGHATNPHLLPLCLPPPLHPMGQCAVHFFVLTLVCAVTAKQTFRAIAFLGETAVFLYLGAFGCSTHKESGVAFRVHLSLFIPASLPVCVCVCVCVFVRVRVCVCVAGLAVMSFEHELDFGLVFAR